MQHPVTGFGNPPMQLLNTPNGEERSVECKRPAVDAIGRKLRHSRQLRLIDDQFGDASHDSPVGLPAFWLGQQDAVLALLAEPKCPWVFARVLSFVWLCRNARDKGT